MSSVQVIVSGHGTFASGMEGALKLLAKAPDNWSFINFAEGMSDKQLAAKFDEVLGDKSQQVVFFTDLAGGTPYKVAATLAYQHSNFQVVAGCNLGSLLETIFSDSDNAKEYAEKLVTVSKQGTQRFETETPKNTQPADDADGI
ncbi:PTS sugar transporter subunit IIA [Schleiferilactobacillus perolens]|uniref:PTS sugar transporter subunit IIA n=1 Tax=Schleiferilactobacillus perolens TaxID=100468 RepID=UPI00235516DF|nr:PTS sugar transporter subunit IIA [Schleiferilactobacillus perolens]MCI1890999.1 PTS sugar transporter subunit IIA [Schleiferilactobacillus harbinensis]MCI1913323.1 PTS sugar transporter subunit IIA [Schleiferilactobacillus harbinensis]MCI2171019.1 PTS sugar transporter subunit IIA [Schleiferilactobacillus perolens]